MPCTRCAHSAILGNREVSSQDAVHGAGHRSGAADHEVLLGELEEPLSEGLTA